MYIYLFLEHENHNIKNLLQIFTVLKMECIRHRKIPQFLNKYIHLKSYKIHINKLFLYNKKKHVKIVTLY